MSQDETDVLVAIEKKKKNEGQKDVVSVVNNVKKIF